MKPVTKSIGHKNGPKLGFAPPFGYVTFESIADIEMGQSPLGTSYNTIGKGAPLINGPTEFREKFPIKIQWTTSPTKFCKKGDILLCVRGSSTGRMNIANDRYCIGRGVAAIRAKGGHDSIFLRYLVESLVDKILRLTNGSTFPNIDSKSLKSISVRVPEREDEVAIGEFIDCWDRAISHTTELITQKELRKKWLMQQLLTGKKQFRDPSRNRVELRLSDIFDRVTTRNVGQNDNVVTISAQQGFVLQQEYFSKQIASEVLDDYFLIKRGDFAYNKSYSNGYPWGAIKRLTQFPKAVVTTLYICFRMKQGVKHSPEYFRHFFEAGLLDKGLTQIAHEGGRAHGLLNVTPSDFFNIKVNVPDKNEQVRIAGVLDRCNLEIELASEQLSNLNDQKKGLMQVLLTGKRKLS